MAPTWSTFSKHGLSGSVSLLTTTAPEHHSAGADDVHERRIPPPHDGEDGEYAYHAFHCSLDLVAYRCDYADNRLRP